MMTHPSATLAPHLPKAITCLNALIAKVHEQSSTFEHCMQEIEYLQLALSLAKAADGESSEQVTSYHTQLAQAIKTRFVYDGLGHDAIVV